MGCGDSAYAVLPGRDAAGFVKNVPPDPSPRTFLSKKDVEMGSSRCGLKLASSSSTYMSCS